MTALAWLNVMLAAASLGLGLVAAGAVQREEARVHLARRAALPQIVEEEGRRPGLYDASGRFVPLREYRRIVSASTTADSLLLALADPSRVLAFSRRSVSESPYAFRYGGKGAIADLDDTEGLLALEPDLLIVSGVRRPDRVARAREAGLEVFDLGETRGVETLVESSHVVALLLGHPERGRELARRMLRRIQAVAASVPAAERPLGIYVSVYPGTIFGGTQGTSYHDVLSAAGIRDAAAEHYTGWPRYTPEQLLALDPELLVTHTGMTGALCRHPGLESLRVCTGGGRIVEIPGQLIGDPGLAMLDAAETLFERVHGDRSAQAAPRVSASEVE